MVLVKLGSVCIRILCSRALNLQNWQLNCDALPEKGKEKQGFVQSLLLCIEYKATNPSSKYECFT